MAIIINNTTEVKNQADNLLTETEKIESANISIEYILDELNEYWSAGQDDQQTFAQGLSKNVEDLKVINDCNNKFGQAIKEYMEVTDATSGNVI